METRFTFASGNISVDFEEDQIHCCGVTSLSIKEIAPRDAKTSQKQVMQDLFTFLTRGYDPRRCRLTGVGQGLLQQIDDESSDYEIRGFLENWCMRVSMFLLTGTRANNKTRRFAEANGLRPLLEHLNPKTGNMIRLYGFQTCNVE